MSTTPAAPASPKLLHVWDVTISTEVNETGPETVNGQTLTVTRKVTKPVVTRMALKHPTRRELRQAELFYGKEVNRFFSMGFLPRSIMVNRHLDLTGGVLSEKERSHAQKLTARHVELEQDLARLATAAEDTTAEKARIQEQIAGIRAEIMNLNAANESVFSQTTEARAQSQLNTWFALFLILVERGGKWVQFFEGETYEQKEEYLFKLEEASDPFYTAAADKISTYTYWFNRGADTPEAFKAMDDEMAKQLAARQAEAEAAKKAAETVTEPSPAAATPAEEAPV